MEFDEAMKVIKMVCVSHKGNLQDHQAIQQALMVVEKGKCECKKDAEMEEETTE